MRTTKIRRKSATWDAADDSLTKVATALDAVQATTLNDNHAIFGEVVAASDQDVVNAIAQGDKIVGITITGDVDALLAAQADRVAEWDKAIAASFPDLA